MFIIYKTYESDLFSLTLLNFIIFPRNTQSSDGMSNTTVNKVKFKSFVYNRRNYFHGKVTIDNIFKQKESVFNKSVCKKEVIQFYQPICQVMKGQTPDENIQLLLKQFQIQQPKFKCSSGNATTLVCINPSCQSNALYCAQQNCNNCSKPHIICENVQLSSFTYILKKRTEGHRQLILKVLQVQNELIQEIQKKRKEIVQKLYFRDLQTKHLKVIQALYFKKQLDFKINGELTEQTYRVLKTTMKEVSQPNIKLLQTFKTQIQTAIKTLNHIQTKLIEKSSKKSTITVSSLDKSTTKVNSIEDSTIIKKEDTVYLIFLSQSFPGAKQFKLLFRASEHGFQAAKFHQFCDNIKHTFTLIKTEFGKVIGGYTPLKWNQIQGAGYVVDIQNLSFLLSFNQGQKMRITQNSKAIYNNQRFGPVFGAGCDVCISNKCNQYNNSYAQFPTSYNCGGLYQKNQQTATAFTGATKGYCFKVAEYEVYQVIW